MIHFLPDRTPESLIDLNCIEKRMVDTKPHDIYTEFF